MPDSPAIAIADPTTKPRRRVWEWKRKIRERYAAKHHKASLYLATLQSAAVVKTQTARDNKGAPGRQVRLQWLVTHKMYGDTPAKIHPWGVTTYFTVISDSGKLCKSFYDACVERIPACGGTLKHLYKVDTTKPKYRLRLKHRESGKGMDIAYWAVYNPAAKELTEQEQEELERAFQAGVREEVRLD